MSKNNVFKKTFIILILIIIPLMITIGAAAWIMISDERIKPQYNPNSVFYMYLNGQDKDYTGEELLPDSNVEGAIDWDKGTITHVCFRKNESGTYVEYTNKLGNSTPLDAGDYLIRYSDSDDDTALLGSDVNFTINKVDPTVSSWPTLNFMYWGNTPSFSSTGDTSNGSFSVVDGSFAFKSGGSRTSAELPYTVSLLYTPTDTTNYNTLTQTADVTLKAVAHVSTTFYATVDEAITSTTSGTIYVMLTESGSDKAKTIGATTDTTTVTLASGVTLYVPYYMDTSTSPYTYNKSQSQTQSDESNLMEYGELYYGKSYNFADSTANSSYLKNYIIIDSDTTLSITSGATLQITGVIGTVDGSTQGHTSGEYAEVKIISGAKIDNYGVVICGGYIKEVNSSLSYINYASSTPDNPYRSQVIVESGGEVRMPFIIHDYRGGTNTAGVYVNGSALGALDGNVDGYISPFNRYDMPNIQTRLTIKYGGLLTGYADLYTGAMSISFISVEARHNTTKISIIGNTSSSLIQMYSGTTIYSDCVTKTAGITTTNFNSRKTTLKFQGTNGGTLNYLAMSITVGITINITTENVYFPIPDLYDIVLTSGSYDISTKVKMLPGASLTVKKGSTLNLNSGFIAYTDFEDAAASNYVKYPTSEQLGTTGANLVVNGTLNINSTSSFGGIVKTEGAGATMNVLTDSLTVNSKEGTGYRSGTNFLFKECNSITEKLRGYAYNNGIINDYTSLLLAGTYYSKEGSGSKFGWYSSEASLFYDANGGSWTGVESSGPYVTGDNGYAITLNSITTTIPTRNHYIFGGWYLNPDCNENDAIFTYNNSTNTFTLVNSYNMFINTTLYAKWIPIDYDITYEYGYVNGATSSGTINEDNLYQTFNADFNSSLNKPTHSLNYVFDGWYLDANYENPVSNLDGSLYVDNKALTLYGRWYPASTPVYVLEYNMINHSNWEIETSFNQIDSIVSENVNNYVYPADYTSINNNTTIPYYFVGWYVDENCTIIFDSNTHLSADSDYIETRTVVNSSGVEVQEQYIDIYYKFDDKAIVTSYDYRPSIETILNTRNTIYIVPGEYKFTDLAASTVTNIKNTFVEVTTHQELSFEFYGYSDSTTKQSLTNITFVSGQEYNIYLHYLMYVNVTFSGEIELGTEAAIYSYKLDNSIVATFSDGQTITLVESGKNSATISTTPLKVLEGTTFTINSARATATVWYVIGSRDFYKTASPSPNGGTIPALKDSNSYSVSLSFSYSES